MSINSQSLLGSRQAIVPTGASGLVGGPASSTSNEVAVFSGTTGKIIKQADGPITITAAGSDQHITMTPSGTGQAITMLNTGSIPSLITDARGVTTIGPNAISCGPVVYGYGSSPGLYVARAQGTLGSETAVGNGNTLLFIGARGWVTGSGFPNASCAAISIQATETYSDTSHLGSEIALAVTATATGTRTEQFRLFSDGSLGVCKGSATPAGGSVAARLLFGTTSGFGIYYGSGVPTVSAAQGSLYLRSDGSSGTRAYINNSAGSGTTWTGITTAA